MIIRRFFGAIIHNQRRRKQILSFRQTFNAYVSSLPKTSNNFDNKIKKKKKSPTLLAPIYHFISRWLFLKPFQLLTDLGDSNVNSATISIDRALRYSGLGMSSPRPSSSSKDNFKTRSSYKNKSSPQDNTTTTTLNSIESLDEPGVLDDLKEAYQEARREGDNVWLDYSHKSCYIYLYRGGGEPSETMAAFDLDGTLIRPKSNKRIPRSATDWELFSVWTKIKLQECLRSKERTRFVIFTNQNGIGLNIVPLEEVQKRIELVTKRLDIPCSVFMAVDKNDFRKPRVGMFQLFNESFNDSLVLNREESFYCGDAIGYPSHSDADIKFAQTLGLPFLTPEKFLRGVKPKLV